MRIHYNNGEKDKIIDNVLSIQVIDGNQPVTVLMANGKELNVSLRNIEMILDETIFEKPKPRTNFDKITENKELLAKFIIGTVTKCQFNNCEDCPLYEVDGCSRKEKIIEWLQQEANND